jgi:hypothetical protein
VWMLLRAHLSCLSGLRLARLLLLLLTNAGHAPCQEKRIAVSASAWMLLRAHVGCVSGSRSARIVCVVSSFLASTSTGHVAAQGKHRQAN